MKRSELKSLIREVIEESISKKFIGFKNDKGEWKIYQLGRNPNAKDWYIDINDPTLNNGFEKAVVEKNAARFLFGATQNKVRAQIDNEEGYNKLLDIDVLNGETIVSIEGQVKDSFLRLHCKSGKVYDINIEDDGDGGNDSHAFISDIDMDKVIGRKIVDARHEDKDSYGVTLKFMTKEMQLGTITIQHDHNGYYGFSYHVSKVKV